jgi:hypothetical protein
VGGQRHVPAALTPRKNRYPFYRRLDGPQVQSGRVRKISLPPGFDPRSFQAEASRFTDWAIAVHPLRTVSHQSADVGHLYKFIVKWFDEAFPWFRNEAFLALN